MLHTPSLHGYPNGTSISGMTTRGWACSSLEKVHESWHSALPKYLWTRINTSPACICGSHDPAVLWAAQGLCKSWHSWYICIFIHSFQREWQFIDLSWGKVWTLSRLAGSKKPLIAVFIQEAAEWNLINGTQLERLPAFIWFPLFKKRCKKCWCCLTLQT